MGREVIVSGIGAVGRRQLVTGGGVAAPRPVERLELLRQSPYRLPSPLIPPVPFNSTPEAWLVARDFLGHCSAVQLALPHYIEPNVAARLKPVLPPVVIDEQRTV
jgi:hypothetical protein